MSEAGARSAPAGAPTDQFHFGWREALLLVASSLTVMAGAILTADQPRIAAQFAKTPHAELLTKLLLTLPALFIAFGAPLIGLTIDRWGRKRIFVAALAFYAIAGSSGLYLSSLPALLVGRALLGIAVAGVMTCATTLIGDYFSGAARARFMGMQAACMALGGVVYVLAGGMLAEIHWRWPFVIYLSSLALVPLARRFVTDRPRRRRDTTQPHPPHNPIAWPIAALVYAIAFVGMVVFYMMPVQLPFYLEATFGTSSTGMGLAIAVASLAGAAASWFNKHFKALFRFPVVFAIMYFCQGLGYALVGGADNYLSLYCGLIIAGFGTGLLIPNANLWLLAIAPETWRGTLVGGLTTALFLGQFCSPIAIYPLAQTIGMSSTFACVGIALIVIAIVFLSTAMLRRRVRTPAPDQ